MRDIFNNISNSTIINGSVVKKAFNKVKETVNEDTAAILSQIAEII